MKPLMLFMIAVVVPTFLGSSRTAPMWLGVQALALAWNGAAHHGLDSLHAGATAIEVLVVRGMAAPWFVRRAAQHHEPVDHLLPSNLFAWILGISIVILAFEFADEAAPGGEALTLGAGCATVVLALLLLSYASAASVQLFALLLLENAALLFESGLRQPWPPWLQAVLSSVYVLTFWVGVRLLSQPREEPDAEVSRPVL